ncbi:MAG TPA: S8 family serine peptidase [Candidatus Thermoplasmatota archaeon]|nr:S8 family serine peptidase [Candidatus Thermoplasmatota archaeon]
MGKLRRVLVLLVAFATLSALPVGPALADPCWGTRGVGAAGERVCVDGHTAAVAPGIVSALESGEHGGLRFVAFDAGGAGRFAILSRAPGAWTDLLPADDALRLRGSNAGGDAVGGPYRLVLLRTPMTSEWHAALAAQGATVHAYVPDNAFLVRADSFRGVEALPFVRGVTGLAPAAKIEPGLVEEGGAQLVNVLTVPGGPGAREETLAALAALGARVVHDAPEVERVTALVDSESLLALAATPSLLWIDRASLQAETDMAIIRQMVGASHLAGLAVPFRGEGVVGEVMDSGLETTHQDFDALLAVDGANAPDSHGTSVFGIVFGSGDGDAQARGMAPDARGVFAWYNSGQTRYAHAATLASAYGGVFQTHSWGRPVPKDNQYDSYANENDRVVNDLDVLMLQSMSNCGPLCARREAMAKNILSVGALYHMDTPQTTDDRWNANMGSMASTGPAADGRIKPELVGPYDAIHTTTVGNGYTYGFGGTSGATPVVAGAVALTNEMHMDGVFAGSSGLPTPATVKALLVASARPYLPHQAMHPVLLNAAGNAMQRDIQGWGLPDLQALHRAGAGALVVQDAPPLRTGESATFTYAPVPGTSATRIVLVWTDVPANPGASKTLVNDLDLVVRDATGALVWQGNVGLRDAPFSAPGGSPDRTNNVENVFLPGLVGGPLAITVRAAAVNLDAVPSTTAIDQDFSLVALSVP